MARSQIENRNFLAPTGFQFNLKRSPKVAFFCNEANIPDLNLGVAVQPNYLRDIPTSVGWCNYTNTIVDGNLRSIGCFPSECNISVVRDIRCRACSQRDSRCRYVKDRQNIYSDGTLQILSSNLVPKFNVNFRDLFPTSLTTLTFDATDTDIQYFTANAEFKYTSYEIVPIGTAPVIPYIPAPTISLTASSTSNVPNNTDVTFTWETTNASQVSINNGVGIVTSPNGRLDVTVVFGDETSRTYTATAIGSGGEQSADITIERTQAATADFFLATYQFTDGRDLDTRTSVVSPTGYGVTVGFGLSDSIPNAGINGEETTLELVLNLFSSQNQILLPTTLVSIPYPWIFVQDGGLVGMLDSNQLWSMLHPLLVVPWFTILPAKPGQTQLLQKLLLDLLRLLASLQTESKDQLRRYGRKNCYYEPWLCWGNSVIHLIPCYNTVIIRCNKWLLILMHFKECGKKILS